MSKGVVSAEEKSERSSSARRFIVGKVEVSKATDDELRASSELDELWGVRCVWAVVVGLVLEAVLAVIHMSYDSIAGRWGSFVADALVALGVFGELRFSERVRRRDHELDRRSNERVAQAEQKAADTNERAAEIEKIAAWRRISPAQHERLVTALQSATRPLDVLIQTQRDDPEAFTYAREIGRAFRDAGVAIRWGQNSFLGSTPVFGILISVDPKFDSGDFVQLFQSAGLQVIVDNQPPAARSTGHSPTPNLYLFVAPKPPPDFTF